ncbi:hypothetical protein ACFSMW_05640 [Virgibacillus halophilus]|uniref:LysM domain-containing protein n=1 Tax=Tigheibacillus halophilus TaxID=361280 RepID=A0ABU5CCY6_9BACI|nr:hypothetical protein [Virgibacillus halophilus]
MSFFKRIFVYFIIFLFIWSIRDDLTNKTMEPNTDSVHHVQTISGGENTQMNEVVKFKTKHGDTVLSVAEKLNGGSLPVSAEQLMADFRIANPKIDPYHLESNTIYYFPVY